MCPRSHRESGQSQVRGAVSLSTSKAAPVRLTASSALPPPTGQAECMLVPDAPQACRLVCSVSYPPQPLARAVPSAWHTLPLSYHSITCQLLRTLQCSASSGGSPGRPPRMRPCPHSSENDPILTHTFFVPMPCSGPMSTPDCQSHKVRGHVCLAYACVLNI